MGDWGDHGAMHADATEVSAKVLAHMSYRAEP